MTGIDLFTVLRPATEVSGDFYDFILTNPESVYFSVGDVSSKGISAALLMPVICKVMRMAIRHLDAPTPQSLLAYIHDDMYHQLSNATMFATMFIGHYQPKHRLLTYANAGHSPVIYKPYHEHARLLQADGTPGWPVGSEHVAQSTASLKSR
ncbi:MAG: PP2C family serine/threonine-protein phosphatase [Caldilineaceae bacterium]